MRNNDEVLREQYLFKICSNIFRGVLGIKLKKLQVKMDCDLV